MDVIVIGGGISGLAMALSLHQGGIPVRVYEQAADPKPLGVGINLQPNAVRELDELGLGPQLAEVGNRTDELSFFNKFGQLIWREPRGLAAGYRWPQISIHRGNLQMILLEAARQRLGPNVRTGLRLVSFVEEGAKVVASFVDAQGQAAGTDAADVLIGADGIHSSVRRQLYPGEGAPRFAQQILWRAAVPAEPFLGGHTMIIAGHFHRRVVVYPIGPAGAGKLLTNWLVQMTVADDMPGREDWNKKVPAAKFFAAIADWRFDWLDVPGLVERTDDIFEFPLVDRDPVENWTFGRVTLIGDAAHPMQPTGSQAGSQAVIDARVLTQALMTIPDPLPALLHYDAARRPAMNDVTLRNRRFGPEAAMQVVEERAPNGFSRVEDVISREELESISRSFHAAAGLDAHTVNNRPSFVHPV
ncbi:MAG TPA: flavin-dependent oxidoreductase [Xanthobacteraceae bacterium]|nr:flavin-dependent oxidoreductase [Xanthobacteraceae bacterium]